MNFIFRVLYNVYKSKFVRDAKVETVDAAMLLLNFGQTSEFLKVANLRNTNIYTQCLTIVNNTF